MTGPTVAPTGGLALRYKHDTRQGAPQILIFGYLDHFSHFDYELTAGGLITAFENQCKHDTRQGATPDVSSLKTETRQGSTSDTSSLKTDTRQGALQHRDRDLPQRRDFGSCQISLS